MVSCLCPHNSSRQFLLKNNTTSDPNGISVGRILKKNVAIFLGSHVPRSMTSTGMRHGSRNNSADERPPPRPRPRTCPAGLTQQRLTNRSQASAHHRAFNAQMSGDGHHGQQSTANERSRTERLMALTLNSRSNKRSGRNSAGVIITKSGYKVTTTPVLASGSQRTIQLVKSVRSPEHEYRMKMVKQH